MHSGVRVDTEYCVPSLVCYLLVVLSEPVHREGDKTYFQWVAVERKRNISYLSKRDRKVLMLNKRCYLHSLDLAFLIHTKLTVSFVRAKKTNLQMQLHCILCITSGSRGAALSSQ